jgi:TRAP-type mannitol/chloroaromatic compound transport system permease small subunit
VLPVLIAQVIDMGTLSAVVAVLSAFAVVMAPFGLHWIALVVGFLALFGAALWGSRPGYFLTAAALMAVSAPVDDAFEMTRAETTALRRAVDAGEPGAATILAVHDVTAPIAGYLIVACLLLVALAVRVAVRRSPDGGWHKFLAESDALGALTVNIGKAASFLYVPMIIIIIYDVTQRKMLDFWPAFSQTEWYRIFSSTKLQEAEWHLHAILFVMCFGFAYIRDAHVRIELVRDRLEPRARVWIELIGCCFFLVAYCYVVMRYGYDFAQKSYEIMEGSSAQTGLPLRFLIKGFLPLGFLVLALAGVSVAVKCLIYLFGPASLRQKAGYYAGTHHADVPQDLRPAQTDR